MARPPKKPVVCKYCPTVRLVQHADKTLVCPKCGVIYAQKKERPNATR